mmetsp:Transcript_34724/g.53293  ORF Transcript_34724/g.53293 Transcript_34724/m.53293 type:complete len:202 (-) Transcript_34724:931-1536(-)
MVDSLREELGVRFKVCVQQLKLLPRLLQTLNQVRESNDLNALDWVASFVAALELDLIELARHVLDSDPQVEQLLLYSVMSFIRLFMLLFSRRKVAFHVFNLLASERLQTFQLHFLEVVLNVLTLLSECQQLLLVLSLQVLKSFKGVALSCKLVDHIVHLTDSSGLPDFGHSPLILIQSLLGDFPSIMEGIIILGSGCRLLH